MESQTNSPLSNNGPSNPTLNPLPTVGEAKEKLSSAVDHAHDKVDELRHAASEKLADGERAAEKLGHRVSEGLHTARDKAGEALHSASEKVSEFTSNARDKAGEVLHTARDKAGEYTQIAREKVEGAGTSLIDWARKNPATALATFLATGFALGVALTASQRRERTFSERFHDDPTATLRDALYSVLTPVRDRVSSAADSTRAAVEDVVSRARHNGHSVGDRIKSLWS